MIENFNNRLAEQGLAPESAAAFEHEARAVLLEAFPLHTFPWIELRLANPDARDQASPMVELRLPGRGADSEAVIVTASSPHELVERARERLRPGRPKEPGHDV